MGRFSCGLSECRVPPQSVPPCAWTKHAAEALVTGPANKTEPTREEWWCVGGEVRGKGGGAGHHQHLKPPLPHPSPSLTRVNPCSALCWKPSVGQREGVFALWAGSQPRVAPAENTHTHSGNIHQNNTYSMAGRSNWLSDPAIGFLKQEETTSVSFCVFGECMNVCLSFGVCLITKQLINAEYVVQSIRTVIVRCVN